MGLCVVCPSPSLKQLLARQDDLHCLLLVYTMPGMPILPQRRSMIVQEALRTPYRQVLRHFNCSISTVSRLVNYRRQHGTNVSPPHPGRPSRFGQQDLLRLKRLLVVNRHCTLRQALHLLEAAHLPMSPSTLRRLACKVAMPKATACIKPFTDQRTRRLRRLYANKHGHDHLDRWQCTLLVDEASMKMNRQVRSWVWRRQGKRYLPECMIPKMLSSKDSCIVWAAVWHGGRSELVRFDTTQSTGKRNGVTEKIYLEQITKGPLNRCWKHLTAWWRGYARPRLVEDGVPIHVHKEKGVPRLVLTLTICPKHTRPGETGQTWERLEISAKVGDLDYDCDYEQ